MVVRHSIATVVLVELNRDFRPTNPLAPEGETVNSRILRILLMSDVHHSNHESDVSFGEGELTVEEVKLTFT